ncbi:MAG: sulfotransferase, partial [Myxococcaceae bacterium]|nr:sulfotransferase [Myxococcaceae bacterium]
SYRCSCGALFRECEFWHGVARRTPELGWPVDPFRTNFWSTYFAPTGRRYLDALLIRSLRQTALTRLRDALVSGLPPLQRRLVATAEANWALARAVLEPKGARVFVDTSRDHQRPKLLSSSPHLDVYVIHLIRDLRANSSSIMKNHGLDAATAASIWRRANLESERGRRFFLPERWLRLRYEELCADVQGTLDRISDFLGVPRAPVPEDFRSVPHHMVGNRMRLGGSGEVREDTSWKERLSEGDLATIARVAGATSRRLGYDWPR